MVGWLDEVSVEQWRPRILRESLHNYIGCLFKVECSRIGSDWFRLQIKPRPKIWIQTAPQNGFLLFSFGLVVA